MNHVLKSLFWDGYTFSSTYLYTGKSMLFKEFQAAFRRLSSDNFELDLTHFFLPYWTLKEKALSNFAF